MRSQARIAADTIRDHIDDLSGTLSPFAYREFLKLIVGDLTPSLTLATAVVAKMRDERTERTGQTTRVKGGGHRPAIGNLGGSQ